MPINIQPYIFNSNERTRILSGGGAAGSLQVRTHQGQDGGGPRPCLLQTHRHHRGRPQEAAVRLPRGQGEVARGAQDQADLQVRPHLQGGEEGGEAGGAQPTTQNPQETVMIFILSCFTQKRADLDFQPLLNIINCMRGNKISQAKGTINSKRRPPCCSYSAAVAQGIVAMVVQGVDLQVGRIEAQARRRKKEISYAKKAAESLFYSYLNQMLADEPTRSTFTSDEPPSHIPMDALAFASIDTAAAKSKPSVLPKQKSLSESSFTEFRASLLQRNRESSVKLTLEPIEEAKYVGQLRQKKINDELSLLREKELLESQRLLNLKKKSDSQISLNFDYDGKVLHRRNIDPGNLVRKIIDGKLKKQRVAKRVDQPPEPEQVAPTQKGKYIKRSRSKVAEDEFTQFIDTQSLAEDLSIGRGILYSHNALVFTQRKPVLAAEELKSSLGRRRLSKNELSRIQELEEKKQRTRLKKMKTELFKESSFSHKRSYSQANFKDSRRRNRGVINVMNPELRSSMLIRLSEYEPYLVIEKEFPDDPALMCEQKEAEPISNLSEFSKFGLETRSRLTESVRMTPALPPIDRRRVQPPLQDDLILTKLQRELQNKLRI